MLCLQPPLITSLTCLLPNRDDISTLITRPEKLVGGNPKFYHPGWEYKALIKTNHSPESWKAEGRGNHTDKEF